MKFKISKEDLERSINESSTYKELLLKLNIPPCGSYYKEIQNLILIFELDGEKFIKKPLDVRYSKYINIKFGELTIINIDKKDPKGNVFVNCLCDCGSLKLIPFIKLKCGRIKTCGCKKTTALTKIYPEKYYTGGISIAQRAVGMYITSAKRRGYTWDLTPEQAFKIMLQECYYCGISPNDKIKHLGIDRVDNSKGYQFDNCVTCCKICNIAKHEMSITEFYDWINRVHKKIQNHEKKEEKIS